MKKVFKKPRITTKRLNTRVHFYKYTENNGPEAGEKEEKLLYSCWASIDGVWLRELEQAISNGTQNDINCIFVIRKVIIYPVKNIILKLNQDISKIV